MAATDECSGLMDERKTENMTVSGSQSVDPPKYSPRNGSTFAWPYAVRDESEKANFSPCMTCTMCIICLLLFAMAVVFVVAPAAGGTLSCDPLMKVGAIIIAAGVCAMITALCCSIYLCCTKMSDFGSSWGAHVFCCFLACLMLVVLLGMAIAGAVLVAENFSTVRNGNYMDDGKSVSCNNSEIPFVLTILSWVICFLVCSCGCVSCYKCCSVILHHAL